MYQIIHKPFTFKSTDEYEVTPLWHSAEQHLASEKLAVLHSCRTCGIMGEISMSLQIYSCPSINVAVWRSLVGTPYCTVGDHWEIRSEWYLYEKSTNHYELRGQFENKLQNSTDLCLNSIEAQWRNRMWSILRNSDKDHLNFKKNQNKSWREVTGNSDPIPR